ncbi:hypothetical protein FNV43_RR26986 [Rhamnella rubrinervis]|uniref:Leucine-rich repeat-containing N-terminal plant-type domain-containing protein n=1 Tax=Rhamnella rubrinervis TaxID=2594499 RepID=A0A8K0DW02_9ROSA|nr:hypothetical protein FNV43_RR26986 [Rhamnella rubrinervis]
MGFSICLILMLFNLVVTNFVTCVQPFACHDHERIALLEFKQSFVIDKNIASRSESAYPKVLQWKSEENNNCCSWDGIECDEENGHVVSLDLSSSCLFGSINSNSTLFQLPYLQRLNLADNHFNYSQIPTLFGRFSRVTYLNLSSSAFPAKSLRRFFLICPICLLLTFLTTMMVLVVKGNLTQLTFLDLQENKLHGSIPQTLANLINLQYLGLGANNLGGTVNFDMLRGPLPIPPPSLMDYNASNNMLNGDISPVFCNLTSLQSLALSNNNLSGMIPQCFGNLSDSLSVLDLRNNSLHGNIPQTLCNDSSNLKLIDLSYNQLQGKLPRSLSKCLMLEGLALSNNQLIDVFPSWLGSLPELKVLTLRSNNLHGEIVGKPKRIPSLLPYDYISHWDSMKTINIQSNIAYIDAYWVYNLSNSYAEYDYRFSITIMYKGVDMYYNAIQDVLAFIDLSSNRFEGEIPKCIGNLEALRSLNLSNNMLTGRIPLSLGDLVLESLDLSKQSLWGNSSRAKAAWISFTLQRLP